MPEPTSRCMCSRSSFCVYASLTINAYTTASPPNGRAPLPSRVSSAERRVNPYPAISKGSSSSRESFEQRGCMITHDDRIVDHCCLFQPMLHRCRSKGPSMKERSAGSRRRCVRPSRTLAGCSPLVNQGNMVFGDTHGDDDVGEPLPHHRPGPSATAASG